MTQEERPVAAIVLDFDGVILESVDIKTDVFRELFAPYPDALDRILEYHLSHNGISRIIKLRHIFEDFLGIPYTPELEQKTIERFSKMAFVRVVRCPFVRGAEKFLQRFSAVCPLYVASASPHEELQRVVKARHLDRYFAGIYGHPVKKQDVLLQAQQDLKVSADDILYIGDSQEDLRVAQESGVRFAGRRNKEPLPENDFPVFDDLSEISRWIDSGGNKKPMR